MAIFRSAMKKLAGGLSRTRQKLVGGLKSLLAGRTIDANLLEELEAMLLQADFGVKSAMQICEDLQTARRENRRPHLGSQCPIRTFSP